uniref:Microtubule-associated protein 9-like n=1 Tax=Cynoglossus semilaevis TaxID=244447 RepID=A0A3P8X638_CYNSE
MTSQKKKNNNVSTASDSASNTDAEHYHCSSDFSEIEEDSSTGKTTANEIEILDDSNKDETKKTTSPESQTIGSCLKGDLCYSDQNDVDDGFVNDLHKSSRTDAVQESNPRISTDGFGLPEDEGRNKHVFKKPTDTCSSPTKYHSHSEKDTDAFVTEFPKSLEKKSDLLKALNSRNRILDFGDFDDAGKRTGKKFSCNSKRNPLFFPDMSANVQERHYSSSKCTGDSVSKPDFHSMPTGDAVTESDQQEALQETKHERLNVSDNLLKEALTPGRLHTPSVSTPSSQLPSHQASSNKDFHSVKWVSEFPHNPEQTPSTVTSSAYPKIHQINTNENLLIQLKSPKPWSSEVKSKYLGTLALLDQQVSLEKSEPLTANLLRAVYYHRWLTKKNEKSKENMLTKKDEEERKKQENQAKRDAAVLSYEAWEKKKKSLEAESKKKQEMMREEKQVCSKQVAERRQSATKAYERRKQEWDRQLKQMYRQKKDEEDIQKRKSLDEKSEKMQSSKKENEWLERKIRNETRKNMKSKTQEEKHRLKEERDQVALKAYEDWLAKKDLK